MILLLLATAALAAAAIVATVGGLARDGYRAVPSIPCRVPERSAAPPETTPDVVRPPRVFAAPRRVRVHAQM